MTEKQYLKKIKSIVTEYAVQKIVSKRRTNIHLKVMASLILLIHKSDTEKISKQIYSLKDSENSMHIFTILEEYTNLLLKDFDETSYEQLEGVNLSDITNDEISFSNMIYIMWKVSEAIHTEKIEELKYPEIFKNQSLILEEYKKLAYDLNITSSLDLSHFYTYLLWNGYFSPNKQHSYQVRDRITSYPTLEVFQGKGVCLNYAELLRDFLNTCGKEAKEVSCLVNSKKVNRNQKYNYLLECKSDITKGEQVKENLIFLVGTPIVKLVGNHSIALVGDKDKTFYYDPTNLFVLNPTKDNKAKIINGYGEFDIKLDFTLNLHDSSKIAKLEDYLANIVLQEKEMVVYTDEEIYETMTNVFNTLKNNNEIVDRVYNGIRPRILKINEEIDKHKINL